MKCTHCNKEIDNDSLYCTYCGVKIVNENNNIVVNQDINKDENNNTVINQDINKDENNNTVISQDINKDENNNTVISQDINKDENNNTVINQDINKDENNNKETKSNNRKGTIKIITTVIVVVIIIVKILNAVGTKESYNNSNIENITPEESTSNNDEIILDRMLQIHNERQKLLPKIDAAYRAFQIHLAKGYFIGTSPDRSRLINYKEEMENLCDEYIRLAYQLSDNEKIVNEAIRQKENIMSAFDNMRLY